MEERKILFTDTYQSGKRTSLGNVKTGLEKKPQLEGRKRENLQRGLGTSSLNG